LVVVLLWRLYFVFVGQEAARQPPPILKADPEAMSAPPQPPDAAGAGLQGLRAREEGVLESYGWVDQKAGIVRIPIEEAMRLLAERGLPSPSPSAAAAEKGKPGSGTPAKVVAPGAKP
jgi:hypothetical protein